MSQTPKGKGSGLSRDIRNNEGPILLSPGKWATFSNSSTSAIYN
jgi:hypothetical protein